jgi:hypothetical protein
MTILNIFNYAKIALTTLLFWSSTILLPLTLSNFLIPSKNFGLILGVSSVIFGQTITLIYFYNFKNYLKPIANKIVNYNFNEALINHFFQPEGFILIFSYLSITWIFNLIPASYYSFDSGINWIHVSLLLLIQDFIQYFFHYLEHKFQIEIWKMSHKLHHKFISPKLFDAFNGSLVDTILIIIIPLIITCRIVPSNGWSYITFGTLYANWLMLIHSEYNHSWDDLFRFIGFGTPLDHHIHHKKFICNYGHTFMYWDKFFGTYRNSLN